MTLFFNIILPKWSNLGFNAAYPKFGIFTAFHIFSQKKFGKTTASLESGRKIESLQEFRNFNSLKFGELIVPRNFSNNSIFFFGGGGVAAAE